MNPIFRSTCFALVLGASSAGLVACGSSNDTASPPSRVPPPPTPVVFSDFVKQQIAATADDTHPEPVDETDFDFDGQENPGAFDDVLAP